jgi:hypothetical protein
MTILAVAFHFLTSSIPFVTGIIRSLIAIKKTEKQPGTAVAGVPLMVPAFFIFYTLANRIMRFKKMRM